MYLTPRDNSRGAFCRNDQDEVNHESKSEKMISYYKPYRAVFAADMLFATLSAAVALTIPLVVRYVTSTLIYQQPQMMLRKLFLIGIGLFVLLALDCYSRFLSEIMDM